MELTLDEKTDRIVSAYDKLLETYYRIEDNIAAECGTWLLVAFIISDKRYLPMEVLERIATSVALYNKRPTNSTTTKLN